MLWWFSDIGVWALPFLGRPEPRVALVVSRGLMASGALYALGAQRDWNLARANRVHPLLWLGPSRIYMFRLDRLLIATPLKGNPGSVSYGKALSPLKTSRRSLRRAATPMSP